MSEFDKVFQQLESPDYPATCNECGLEGTNASIEEHVCQPSNESPAPRAGERDVAYRTVAYLVCDGIVNCDKYYPPDIATWARDLMINEQRVGITLIRESIEQYSQRSTLLAQRDRLLRLLRPVTSPTACYCAVMESEKCWHCEARELITPIEQEVKS